MTEAATLGRFLPRILKAQRGNVAGEARHDERHVPGRLTVRLQGPAFFTAAIVLSDALDRVDCVSNVGATFILLSGFNFFEHINLA